MRRTGRPNLEDVPHDFLPFHIYRTWIELTEEFLNQKEYELHPEE